MTMPKAFDIEPHLIAGVIGSLVSMRFMPGDTWQTRLLNLVGGASAAFFVAPPLAPRLGLPQHGEMAALAFLIGMLGVVLLDKCVKMVLGLTFDHVLSALPWKAGGGKKGGE